MAPALRFPDFCRSFEIHTDGVCSAGIGIILCQRDPHNRRAYAVAYASRSLSPIERNYGTKFTAVTDYHALQFLQSSRSSDLRGRLAR
ncbi:unnamed protein product [Rhizopus microsporus]|nr:hypothetical protein BCV71DRAFT_268257 [Rhizopus microsporus]